MCSASNKPTNYVADYILHKRVSFAMPNISTWDKEVWRTEARLYGWRKTL